MQPQISVLDTWPKYQHKFLLPHVWRSWWDIFQRSVLQQNKDTERTHCLRLVYLKMAVFKSGHTHIMCSPERRTQHAFHSKAFVCKQLPIKLWSWPWPDCREQSSTTFASHWPLSSAKVIVVWLIHLLCVMGINEGRDIWSKAVEKQI